MLRLCGFLYCERILLCLASTITINVTLSYTTLADFCNFSIIKGIHQYSYGNRHQCGGPESIVWLYSADLLFTAFVALGNFLNLLLCAAVSSFEN
jgi:hypothetical protein